MNFLLKTEIEKIDYINSSEAEEELNDLVAKCGEIFMHNRQQNELFIFLCTLCEKKFDTITKYTDHIEKEHLYVDNEETVSEVQEATFALVDGNNAKTYTHINEAQEIGILELTDDSYEAKNEDTIYNPFSQHNQSQNNDEFENFIVNDGEISTCAGEGLPSHHKIEIEISPTFCSKNTDETKQIKTMNKIKRKRKKLQDLYQCTDCGKPFKRKSNLKTHELSHQLVKPFACTMCNATFVNKQNLVIHERRHKGEKPFSCKFCHKSFVSSTERNSHLRCHTGERPYICEDCGKAHTTSSQLLEHRKQHTGERRYKCSECQKCFRTSTHLRTHINAIHENLPRSFNCALCDASFKTLMSLHQHSKIHAKEKRYKCRFCSKAFAQHPGLYAHLKTHKKNDAKKLCHDRPNSVTTMCK